MKLSLQSFTYQVLQNNVTDRSEDSMWLLFVQLWQFAKTYRDKTLPIIDG